MPTSTSSRHAAMTAAISSAETGFFSSRSTSRTMPLNPGAAFSSTARLCASGVSMPLSTRRISAVGRKPTRVSNVVSA